MYRLQPSAALPLSTRAVVASEPDVLVTRLAIRHAGSRTTTASAGPWCMTAWSCMLPVMAEPSACPTFSRMKLGRSAVLLVSPGWALYFDLALSSHRGFFRASVRLARSLLEHPQLTRWSVDELVVLFTLQAGEPAYYGLRRTSSWCDLMDVCDSKQVTDILPERTLCVYDKRAWQHVSDC